MPLPTLIVQVSLIASIVLVIACNEAFSFDQPIYRLAIGSDFLCVTKPHNKPDPILVWLLW
jgi:hypothetical protein